MANGLASNSDFKSSNLNRQQKLSPLAKITSFSCMLFAKLLSDTASLLGFTAFANPFCFTLRSSISTFPIWFGQVAGLKVAMSSTNDNEPRKSIVGGNIVVRSSMKFNTPNLAPNLGAGSATERNSLSIVFSVGDDDEDVDDKEEDTMEIDLSEDDEEDSTDVSLSPQTDEKSSTIMSGIRDDKDDDPIEVDLFASTNNLRALRHSLPVPIISPFSRNATSRTLIYDSVSSTPRENVSRDACSPIKGKVKAPEDKLIIKEPPLPPLLIDTGHGFMAYDPDNEIEKYEEYTCVTARRPNPKTTHIFCDYVFERHTSKSPKLDLKKELNKYKKNDNGADFIYPSNRFLTYCYGCGKKLDHREDIYMYRSDRAFCSAECREVIILADEELMKMKKAKAAAAAAEAATTTAAEAAAAGSTSRGPDGSN